MADMTRRIIYSQETDPWYNLALEEYLLNGVANNEVILYLWQNVRTVVIGRNQNAWKECRYRRLEEEGGKLARRLSGGGAVYHDLGNLNFTFIMKRELYNLEKQLKVILKAAKEMGIAARFSGRNDLVVDDGRKFSGNAFYLTGKGSYHHGTILVNSDFEKMLDYLQVSREKIRSKGIESVRSRVINLKELNQELTIDKMKEAMKASFIKVYVGGSGLREEADVERINPVEMSEMEELYQKYSSWEWRFGQTPEFDISFEKRFDWGGIEMCFNLKKGIIEEAVIYSDAMDSRLIQEMAVALKGKSFQQDTLILSLESLTVNEEGKRIIKDVVDWLKTRDI
ncbi:MAG TPA: lipoate--protein ligase [Halanaerobiales bacterium]|nr:lipoate--protein ligase [Halanaerobiales bacterium]